MQNDSINTLEEWRSVVGYEGYYSVSNYGRVRNDRREARRQVGLIISQARKPTGYRFVSLYRNGVSTARYTHRLVLEAFVGPCPVGCQARHFPDRDPSNNRLSNLQWGTRVENAADKHVHGTALAAHSETHPSAKLTNDSVRAIRDELAAGGSDAVIARRYHVDPSSINNIKRRKTWKHV